MIASAVRLPMPGTDVISSTFAAANRLSEPNRVNSALRRISPRPGMASSADAVIRLDRRSRW